MQDLKVIAVTHKNTDLTSIGKYHIDEDQQASFLPVFKNKVGVGELLFISTCNRVEFVFTHSEPIDDEFIYRFLQAYFGAEEKTNIEEARKEITIHEGKDALKHLFMVSSSLDSMVIVRGSRSAIFSRTSLRLRMISDTSSRTPGMTLISCITASNFTEVIAAP